MIQGGEDQLFWDIRGDREQGETWAGVSKRTRCVCLVNGCALVPEADTSQVVHVGRREAMQRWEKRDVSRWGKRAAARVGASGLAYRQSRGRQICSTRLHSKTSLAGAPRILPQWYIIASTIDIMEQENDDSEAPRGRALGRSRGSRLRIKFSKEWVGAE